LFEQGEVWRSNNLLFQGVVVFLAAGGLAEKIFSRPNKVDILLF